MKYLVYKKQAYFLQYPSNYTLDRLNYFSQLHLAHQAFGTESLATRYYTPMMVSWQRGDKDTMILNVVGNALFRRGRFCSSHLTKQNSLFIHSNKIEWKKQ